MIIFLLQFLLTNILFATIICTVFIRLNREKAYSNLELFLYALGLGPALTSLFLYYSLLFIPGFSHLFYFLIVLLGYSTLFAAGRKHFPTLWNELSFKISEFIQGWSQRSSRKKVELIIFTTVLLAFILSFLFLYFPTMFQAPLDGTDALKHAAFGKIYAAENSLAYRWIRPHPQTGFYFIFNNPGPSFSLLLTWEKISGSLFNIDQDLYFKFISPYYAFLIIGVFLFWVSRKSKYLALLGLFALLFGFSFFQTLVTQHLDSYRILFLVLSWIFLANSVQKRDKLSFILLGIFSGFAAFTHTIGAIIVLFNFLALFIFLKGDLRYKWIKTRNVILLAVALGWFHYIIDIFWGYGWVIFERQISYWG
jgi:hypothetical protein